MGKAVVIGIVIVLAIIGVLVGARHFEKGEPKDFGICVVCIFLLAVVMIFGGIWCF